MVYCTIVGTGDMAHGLAHLFHNHNTELYGNKLAVASTSGKNFGSTFHLTGVPVLSLTAAVTHADIIILAIPAKALRTFVMDNLKDLQDKILVDVTNSDIRGEDLSSICGLTDMRWVKAFNDIGAVDVLLNKPCAKEKISTTMCTRDEHTLSVVKRFAEDSLGLSVKVVPFERFHDVAMNQNSLGNEWIHASNVILILFALTEAYAVLRYNVFKGYAWYHLPLQVTNKAVCWTALNAFALSQLPGLFARLVNSIQGDKVRTKSPRLRWALGIRKQLGLLALWMLVLHVLLSIFLFNPAYYGKFFEDPKASSSKLNAIGESSFLFGFLGFMLYVILGSCSLPSIGKNMTSRQWQFVYGPLAWMALMFGIVHVLIMGVAGWTKTDSWPGGLPPITMTSTLLPMAIVALKLAQMAVSKVSATTSSSTTHPAETTHRSFPTLPQSSRAICVVDDNASSTTETTNNNNNNNNNHNKIYRSVSHDVEESEAM